MPVRELPIYGVGNTKALPNASSAYGGKNGSRQHDGAPHRPHHRRWPCRACHSRRALCGELHAGGLALCHRRHDRLARATNVANGLASRDLKPGHVPGFSFAGLRRAGEPARRWKRPAMVARPAGATMALYAARRVMAGGQPWLGHGDGVATRRASGRSPACRASRNRARRNHASGRSRRRVDGAGG